MKKWIHASSYQSNIINKISSAKKDLERYDAEQVEYVKDCQRAISDAISKYYADGLDEKDYNIGSELSSIKKDYMLGAIEDDLMTEDEFEDIFDLFDIINLELSSPYA